MATRGSREHAGDKPVFWIASSRRDIRTFPKPVRTTFGQALYDAQTGEKHPDAKPLKGFGGAGVLEIVEDDNGSMKCAPGAGPVTYHYWAKARSLCHVSYPSVLLC